MNFLEKTSVFLTGLAATGASILAGSLVIKYLLNMSSVMINASTLTTGFFGGMFIGFGVSVLALLISVGVIGESGDDLTDSDCVKFLISLPLIVNALAILFTSLFANDFLSTFFFLAKMDVINLSILLVALVSLASIALTFTSDDIYKFCKAKVKNFFMKKKTAKEKVKKELKEIQSTSTKLLEKNYNLDVFDESQHLPPSMNEKIVELKTMIEYLKSKTGEVEIQSEIQMLLDNTLPKIIMLYEKADNKQNKNEVENALGNVVSYFKNFTQSMKQKDEYQEKLDLETEISYINKKYLKQAN